MKSGRTSVLTFVSATRNSIHMYISRVNLQESCFDAFAIELARLDNEFLCSYRDISYSCGSRRLFRDR